MLAFTGGVGEHSVKVRREVCGRAGFLGVAVGAGNETGAGDREIGEGRVRVFVVEAREEWEMARQCARIFSEV